MEKQTETINRLVDDYADTIQRICYSYTKNYHDTQDIIQNVFLKYMQKHPQFESAEHEKAWILRVTINACKDSLRSIFRKHESLEFVELAIDEKEDYSYVREAVCKLPAKYRNVIILYYFEELSAVEIAKILNKKENTIYTWLSRAKDKLKEMLGGDFFEESDTTSIGTN